MSSLTRLYRMKEIYEHNTKEDCWVIIHGKVYNVSSFMAEHPGGEIPLIVYAGDDATDEFESAGHSKSARELMEKFFIGEVYNPVYVTPETKTDESSNNISQSSSQKVRDFTKWDFFVVGISMALGFFLGKKSSRNC